MSRSAGAPDNEHRGRTSATPTRIYDIDGVLRHLRSQQNPTPEVVEKIIQLERERRLLQELEMR